ncbi:MAG: ribosomal-processing cysteine protease Prp [Oscillospiraceae bacterium]|nr:ribosomal-processing cysteine protease Prp [Oscillospiraceae bacterium]
MIQVRYEAPCRMTFSGHAGYAAVGQDIVCAGISALWGTLAADLALRGEGACIERGKLSCNRDSEADMERSFQMIWRGILLLAEKYPDFISAKRAW